MTILVLFVFLMIEVFGIGKRQMHNCFSKEQLRQFPTHRFSRGDDYDLCSICLDNFKVGNKLRILPCSHAYHRKCVDLWLTHAKKTCPLCRQRVSLKKEQIKCKSEEENRA